MKKRDKNKIILVISAILIVISIIITLVAFIYEKNLAENKDVSKKPQTTANDKIKDDITKENKPHTTKTPAETKVPDTTQEPDTAQEDKVDIGSNKPGKYRVITKETPLSISTKPQAGANKSGNVPKGAEVDILATYDGWAFYHSDTSFGWLSMDYLELISEGELPKYSIGKYKVATNSQSVYIREEPENYTAVRGRAQKDAEVEVLTVAGDWGYVEHNANSGWISFDSLEKVN